MGKLAIIFLAFTVIYSGHNLAPVSANEEEAKAYLKELETRYSEACNKNNIINWNFSTNVTKENEAAANAASNAYSQFQADIQKEINTKFPTWDKFTNPSLKREFKNLAIAGPGDIPKDQVEAINALSSKMETAYAQSTVCQYKNPSNCTLHLDPDITNVLKSSRDFAELEHYWTAWHDTLGSKVTVDDYEKFAAFLKKVAVVNRFKDMSDFWADPYDDGTKGFSSDKFMKDMKDVWKKLQPYFSKLHAYVRMKMRPLYKDHIGKDGYMPVNIMGNMWAQDWTNLDQITKPYPETPSLDCTEAMVKANFDVDRMFKESDKFFGGLGLETMTDTFWSKSMFKRPTDGREVVCHPTANDFCSGKKDGDYRIKMCAQVNMEDLVTIHHEMGHIQYYMQYKDKDFIFRTGANPGFHEAIGDALALAVTTPTHLQCVLGLDLGLEIKCPNTTSAAGRSAAGKGKGDKKHDHKNDQDKDLPAGVTKMDINFLYYKALDKFSFFPFALLIDIWRFEVFSGKLTKDKYVDRWWELRKEYQGVIPPNKRKSTNFDPASKYHIVSNVEYVRYFVSHILQFQFYEAMCIAAGEYSRVKPKKPLYQCDFTGSKAAGKIFGDMMKMGYEKPWPEALEKITKIKTLSIEPLMNYFKPLFELIEKALVKGKERPCFGTQKC